MTKLLRQYIWLFLIAGLVIVSDQLTKTWVRHNLALGEVFRPELWLSQYARLVHVHNSGAVFGLFPNLSSLFSILPLVIGAVIILAVPRVPRQDWMILLAMGLYLGGAIGNLIDRWTIGTVTDFISIGKFAVFNIADASLSLGLVFLITGVLLQEKRKQNAR